MLKLLRTKLSANIIFGFVVILILFSLLISFIGYREFTRVLDERYADNGYRIGSMAGQVLDLDDFDLYLTEEGRSTKEYRTTVKNLQGIADHMGATFIYLIEPDTTDYRHIKFICSVMEKDAGYTLFEPGYVRETSNDEYAQKYRDIMEGRSDSAAVFRDQFHTDTGAHVTAMIPATNNDGDIIGIICVQRQMEALDAPRDQFLLHLALAALFTVLLVAAIYGWFLSRRVSKPIRAIATETVRFSRENTLPDISLTESIRGEDEVKLLAMHVDKMELAIDQYIKNLSSVTSERDRMESELNVASGIQKGILPTIFPPFPERDEFDLYASMDPAKEVGGDFYDFFFVDDTHLALVMADVSGKGVPAALFMMGSKILIKNRAVMGGTPGEILEDVNTQLCEGNHTGMFVTAWLGILDVTTGELITANAGHEYPAICRADGTFELFKDRHSFVLAGMSGTKFKEEHITMQPGDTLFVYTDGVAEAINADEELFGMERMLTALNRSPHAAPDELLRNMTDSIRAFTGETEQFDDITMLALQFRGPRSHLRTLRIEACEENLPQVIEWVEEMLQILDVPPKDQMQIDLAVEEVFVNIAKYAYAPGVGHALIRMGYDMDTQTVKLTFLDSGISYDPLEREDPNTTLSAEDREVGGLGIFLVKKSMDKVEYTRNQDFNVLSLEKKIDR